MKHILEQLAEERLSYLVNGHDLRQEPQVGDLEVMERKKKLLEKRKIEMIKAKAKAVIDNVQVEDDGTTCIRYIIHFEYLYKEQDETLYMEEHIEERVAFLYDQILIKDQEVKKNRRDLVKAKALLTIPRKKGRRLAELFNMTGSERYNMPKNIGTSVIRLIKISAIIVRILFLSVFMQGSTNARPPKQRVWLVDETKFLEL